MLNRQRDSMISIAVISSLILTVYASPEPGKLVIRLEPGAVASAPPRTLYKGSTISMSIARKDECSPKNSVLAFKWVIRSTSCYTVYSGDISNNKKEYFDHPGYMSSLENGGVYLMNGGSGESIDCNDTLVTPKDFSNATWISYPNASEVVKNDHQSAENKADENIVARTPIDSRYILIMSMEGYGNFSYECTIEMKTPKGFLSAQDYPILTYFSVRIALYVLLIVIWVVASARNRHDLLRVQIWIGIVLLLTLIESILFYSCYAYVNNTGMTVSFSLDMFTELFSAVVGSIDRMLIIAISLGVGIITTQHYKIAIWFSLCYFVFDATLAISEVEHITKLYHIIIIPVGILNVILVVGFLVGLLRTMKILRMQENHDQLSRFRYFSIGLAIFLVGHFIKIIKIAYASSCGGDWGRYWLQDVAYFFMMKSLILIFAMILWRPRKKTKPVSFSQLTNEEDHEDMEEVLFEANHDTGGTEDDEVRSEEDGAERKESPQPAVMELS